MSQYHSSAVNFTGKCVSKDHSTRNLPIFATNMNDTSKCMFC